LRVWGRYKHGKCFYHRCEDLYDQLKVIDIELPPLHERREDIRLLVQHFIDKFSDETKKISGLSEDALKLLVNHSWPGNLRELESVIQRAITLTQYEMILADDLPSSMLKKSEGTFWTGAFERNTQ
jgi:two-component system response regulator AtoC